MRIESPVLDDFAKYVTWIKLQGAILDLLQARFGPVPADVEARVKAVTDEQALRQVNVHAGTCTDLDTFRGQLPS
jgi:hypothetical protein